MYVLKSFKIIFNKKRISKFLSLENKIQSILFKIIHKNWIKDILMLINIPMILLNKLWLAESAISVGRGQIL